MQVKYLGKSPYTYTRVTALKTKNPPYHALAVDLWGLFKSDYTKNSGYDNIDKVTTPISNKSTDVWSLRKIRSGLGQELCINYEGDTYSRSVLNNNRSIMSSSVSRIDPTHLKIIIDDKSSSLLHLLKQGDRFRGLFLCKKTSIEQNRHVDSYFTVDTEKWSTAPVVESINNKEVIVVLAASSLLELHKDHEITYPKWRPLTCNVNVGYNDIDYGGGIRVKQLISENNDGSKNIVEYGYSNPLVTNSTSGITSYTPVSFDPDNANQYGDEAKNVFRNALYQKMNYLLSVAREVPAPGVMYEYFSIENRLLPIGGETSVPKGGKVVYQYEVFNKNMIGISEKLYSNSGNVIKRNLAIKDYTSRVGSLKRIIAYDINNNKLTEKIAHYLHDGIAAKSFEQQSVEYESMLAPYSYQGVIQERFGDSRNVSRPGSQNEKIIVMSAKESYPVIPLGVSQIDYVNGTRIQQQTLGFDFFSGSVTKTLTTDSYGNRFISEMKPAYRQYGNMGLKVSNIANKHMLSQEAANYTYKVNASNEPLGIVSASVTTWGNDVSVTDEVGNDLVQALVWRKKADFQWKNTLNSNDGLTPYASFQDFFSGGHNNQSWKKVNEITKYDVYSHALEAADMKGVYAATRMGYNNSKVIVSGGPARYNELAYTGIEDQPTSSSKFSCNISKGDGNVTNAQAHTGTQSLKLEAGKEGMIYQVALNKLDTKRDFAVAVWFKPENGNIDAAKLFYQVDGHPKELSNSTYQKTAAGWYLLELKVPSHKLTSGTTLKVGCKNTGMDNSLYFDDFRFQPSTAAATAYVYNQKTGELNYIIGANNLYTKYEYDAIGRLVKTYKEVLGKSSVPLVSKVKYNYRNYVQGTTVVPNWQDIGEQECVTLFGNNTGEERKRQKDMNPFSLTAHQYKWVSLGKTSACPTAVHARVEVQYLPGVYHSGPGIAYFSQQEADVYVRFYTDETFAVRCPAPIATSILINQHYYFYNAEGTGKSDDLLFNWIDTSEDERYIGRFMHQYYNRDEFENEDYYGYNFTLKGEFEYSYIPGETIYLPNTY